MKKSIIVSLVLLVWLFINSVCLAKEPVKLRIGWQVPWAIQGQIVQVMKHTNILARNGITAIFVGRNYGPELNEAALAGEIDVILTADQPAAALFAKEKGWIGIGKLMYNRTTTYVPPYSPIKALSGLKSKTIGVPVGAAAERIIKKALIDIGFDPTKDMKFINVGIREQVPIVMSKKNASSWDSVDALSGFDPLPAVFEANGMVKVIHAGKVVSLVVMNQVFVDRNPEAAKNYMRAVVDAYDYYRQNLVEANAWFIKEAGIKDANQEVCDIAARIEPNVWAKSRQEIRVQFSEEDFKLMQEGADFIVRATGKNINMKNYVTNKYVIEPK